MRKNLKSKMPHSEPTVPVWAELNPGISAWKRGTALSSNGLTEGEKPAKGLSAPPGARINSM
jgi:hypothetical protein